MTRLMYDSVNANAIPTNAQMVAGYVDGSFVWSAAAWARFPNAVKVKIAAASYVPGANVYDIENGDFTPAEGAQAIMLARSHGENPTAYMSYNTWNAVKVAFASNGWADPPYWVADYDNSPVLFTGSIAKQYANSVINGANYDLSIVADFWPGVDQAAGGDSNSVTGEDMVRLVVGDSGTNDPHGKGAVYVTDGYDKRYITDPNSLPGWYAFLSIQTPEVVAQGMLNEIPEVNPGDYSSILAAIKAIPAGPQGLQGIQGIQGPPGPPGQNADPTTVESDFFSRVVAAIKKALGF